MYIEQKSLAWTGKLSVYCVQLNLAHVARNKTLNK